MQAMIYRRYGGPEVLRLEDLAKPPPGPKDVLVQIHAASLNAVDTYLLKGEPALGEVIVKCVIMTRSTTSAV